MENHLVIFYNVILWWKHDEQGCLFAILLMWVFGPRQLLQSGHAFGKALVPCYSGSLSKKLSFVCCPGLNPDVLIWFGVCCFSKKKKKKTWVFAFFFSLKKKSQVAFFHYFTKPMGVYFFQWSKGYLSIYAKFLMLFTIWQDIFLILKLVTVEVVPQY